MVMPTRLPPKLELKERYEIVAPAYRRVLERTGGRLSHILEGRGLKFAIRYRVKDFESYYQKLIRRARQSGAAPRNGGSAELARSSLFGRNVPVITDLLGLRVVCHFLEDLDAARDAIEEIFEVIESEMKGSEYSPREFGYQSVHYLVRLPEELWVSDLEEAAGPPIAEIQLRTILQDAWAEVEHEILYKAEFTPLDEPLRRKLAALNANLTLSDIMFQELREYQRQLHGALAKRRAEFQKQLEATNAATAGFAADMEAPAARAAHDGRRQDEEPRDGSPPANHRETLDNLLLDALTAHNRGEVDRAIAIYTHILETEVPTSVEAVILVHRGMAYVSRGDLERAIADFDEAHRIDPKNARPPQLRAAAYRAGGELARAAADIAEAVRLDPFFPDALILGAQIALDMGESETARSYCLQAAEMCPEDDRVTKMLTDLR